MFRFSRKLKSLKTYIREFSRENHSNIEKRVKEAHLVVIVLQSQLISNLSPALAQLERTGNSKWQTLIHAEESFLYQRSRVTWIRKGDMNSPYFHRMAASRQVVNHIHYLVDCYGNMIDSQSNIENHCVNFFQIFLVIQGSQHSLSWMT